MPLYVEDATGFALEDGTDLYLENEFDIVDSDTLSITDAGETIGVAAADTLTATDAGETLAVDIRDDDFSALTDESATVAAALTDADDPASIVDDGIATVPVSDSDTATIADAGELLAVTTSDADTGTVVEDQSLAVAVTDTDPATIAEGEAVGVGTTVTPISDADTLTITETAALVVAISDSDSATITENQTSPVTPSAAVMFGDNPAATYTTDSPTQITAISPASDDPITVDVTVETDVGISPITPADIYEYTTTTNPPPSVTSVTPGVGPAAGGTTVVIAGTNFVGILSVQFGSFTADPAHWTVDSPTQITALSPPGSGAVDVTVSNDGGDSPLDPAHDRFTYAAPPAVPTVTAVSPSSGLLGGGNTVLVSGSGFVSIVAVLFGGVACDPTSIVVIDAAHLTCTVPPASARGSVDVQVRNTTGTSVVSAGDSYTYTSAAPALLIKSITLADGTIITDFTPPPIVSAVVGFTWKAVDDFDAVLADTWIEQTGSTGRLTTGVWTGADDLYAHNYNTVQLADGFHLIDAAGTDSEGNTGRSPGVLIQVSNGLGTGAPNAPANPDYVHPKPIAAVAAHIQTALAPPTATPGAPALHPAVAQAVVAVTADLEENHKALEDWLNRNTVRRLWVANLLGTDHAHSDTGWIDVAPITEVVVQKAQPRSVLVVTVGVAGQYNDDTPPHYVDLGVRVTGPAGYDRDFFVGRKTGRVNHESMQHAFVVLQARDAGSGTYRVRLRVRTQRTDVAWLSTSNDTISLSVTEAPGT